MPTGRWTYRSRWPRRNLPRLAAALVPLPGLVMPAVAYAEPSVTIAICSGSGERAITLPAREAPPPRPDDRQGCAHFVCPRERADGSLTDDDEE
jgi:hypothetical protein